MYDRAKVIDDSFIHAVKNQTLPATTLQSNYSPSLLADLFDTQLMSRHQDLMARRNSGKVFYTIGSSGHEGLAALAATSRLTDMAFLHYRDAAFCIQRSKQIDGSTTLWHMMLSFVAGSEDPVSGGRHKVLGGKDIFTPPQTSTIASHLPKAVGAAHSIGLRHSILPKDSVILCSFGDASSNHSTALGAINTACWASFQSSPMPIVFICEDNDIGISVRTPNGWIEANFADRAGLFYIACDGTDIVDALRGCRKAVDYARKRRKPVFLHFKTVRLTGHAGADVEAMYTPLTEIKACEAHDPLLKTASHMIHSGTMTPTDVIAAYNTMRARVARVADAVVARPKLLTANAIMDAIIPKAGNISVEIPTEKQLADVGCRQSNRPFSLSKQINRTLAELLLTYPNALLFGQDVGRKGGVYGITTRLLKKFGPARVQDTLLDEQSILGMAIGSSLTGYLPVPEIQFLAYLHNAEDQIRGEAATMSFFSNDQFQNPMVIRIAGLAYQQGFGGHFHNDNSINVLRDIPGIIVACPSNGDDARKMLRECFRLAHIERRIVVFLEPIALYNTTDLHEGDDGWATPYVLPHHDDEIQLGQVGQWGEGTDVCILTYGNGYYLSRQAAKDFGDIKVRIVDIRWLHPLPMKDILECVKPCKRVVIVDECRETGSLSEELMAKLLEAGITANIRRVTGADSFIPLGNAAFAVLLSVDDIRNTVMGVA